MIAPALDPGTTPTLAPGSGEIFIVTNVATV